MNKATAPPVYRNRAASVVLAAACLLLAGPALANTVTVTTLEDTHVDGQTTLREAISQTGPGGTIIFQAGLTGPIKLTSGQLVIGRNVTITGPGAPARCSVASTVTRARENPPSRKSAEHYLDETMNPEHRHRM
jgi:hypothetical protein